MHDHSTLVQGIAAGVGGAILALLGVDAQTLTAALIGCVIGAGAAQPTGRLHGLCLFLASVCASAECAAVLGPVADAYTDAWLPMVDGSAWRRAIALVVGVLLHPVVQGATQVMPGIVRRLSNLLPGSNP